MGYRIVYDGIEIKKYQRHVKWGRWVAFACVVLLVAGAITVKTVGLTWVQEVLLPGDPAVTAAALEGLVEDLRAGDSLGKAIKGFCEEIIDNGNFPK